MKTCLLNFILKCIYTSSSSFHSSCFLLSSRQTGNAMKKVLGGTTKKKFHYKETPVLPSANTFSKGSLEGKKSGNSRRATVLNKLFMQHITELMANGEHSSEILGHGIEVNRVKVTPDYKFLHIYWIARNTDHDEVVDKILQKNAGFLRHELSQLRVMGVVPMIKFIKDKHYAQIIEVHNRLSRADFGEDYTPVDHTRKLKTEFQLSMALEDDIKKKIDRLETKHLEENDEAPLPPMPQNVLGLNHADILNRIRKSMKKSEAIHRLSCNTSTDESWEEFKLTQAVNEDPVHYANHREQREAFKNFLQKRLIMRSKAKSGEKNYLPDLDYIKEELRENHLNSIKDFDARQQLDDDFIIEEFEDKDVTR